MRHPKLPDPQRVIACLRETAVEDILPRFRALKVGDVMEKGPDDPVTVADIASEKRLTRMLADLVPGSVVVAEEAVHRDPSLLDLLKQERPVWLIDPIGGTKTFLRGEPGFGIYVSLLQDGQALAGWVHDPVSGATTFAALGEGAWENGRRIAAASDCGLSAMRCYVHPNVYGYEEGETVRGRQAAFAEVVPLGCVGSAFCALAAGRIQVGVFASMWPWDHAPGVLILREAGGYAARRDGAPYSPTERFQGLLAAPDAESWRCVRDLLERN